jgi:hypothetical protein
VYLVSLTVFPEAREPVKDSLNNYIKTTSLVGLVTFAVLG